MSWKHNAMIFTQVFLDSLPTPVKGYAIYRDAKTGYLSLYITPKGVKTFFVRKRVRGRDERLIIGRYPIVSIEQARKKATIFCGIIADRKDPLEEFKKEKLNNQTFGEHFRDYMHRYSKMRKKSWVYDEREINRFCAKWFTCRLSSISKHDVELLHEEIARNNGATQANTIVKRLSSIFNKAIEWGWSGTNPAKGIKKFKEQSRDRFIMPDELPYVMRALEQEHNEELRDYFYILFLTGARKTNTRMMSWKEIDFELAVWRISETKNREPLILPLVKPVLEILQRRRVISASKWVFPQKENPKRHIIDPIKAWKRILCNATLEFWNTHPETASFIDAHSSKFLSYYADYTKVDKLKTIAVKEGFDLPRCFTDIRIHDIRRTFGSYQALAGASLPIIARSLGHKSLRSTEIYARLNLDPVRESVHRATYAMLSMRTSN